MSMPAIAQVGTVGQPSAAQVAQSAFEKCILEATDKYKSSNESADTIAEGALGKCEGLKYNWVDAFEHQGVTYSFAAKTKIEESYFANVKAMSISRTLDNRTGK